MNKIEFVYSVAASTLLALLGFYSLTILTQGVVALFQKEINKRENKKRLASWEKFRNDNGK